MKTEELYKIYKSTPKIHTDTRKIKEPGIFFALKGEHFNGNKFAERAINNGCNLAIIDEEKYDNNEKFILVENTLKTLQYLAEYHRSKLSIPIIGITGTNGKTTSKELIHCVLKSELNCYSTKGNMNNHIGVPLSILEINNEHEIAVIEMGANHEKEIEFLCDITKPTHGVITNIGSAHLEGFKTLEGIINTKNELYTFIKKNNGSLFINDDDNLLINLAKNIRTNSYGLSSSLNITIKKDTPFLNVKWEDSIIKSQLIGEYQYYNISLAICIGNYFNISKSNIQSSIESYIPQNNRSEIKKTSKNIIIMDAYNANPSSMKAMLYSFAKQDYDNKLCILGDMLELGDYSIKEHANILKLCDSLQLESLFVGKEFHKLNNESFKDTSSLEEHIKTNPIKNKTILLKGSRGIGLEQLVDVL